MNSKNNKQIRKLGEEIASITLKRRKNYKCRLHNKVRDFFIKNLDMISEGLEFIAKELRIVGGDIDIVAKKGDIFYLIEIKTRLSRHMMYDSHQIAQLLHHLKGLNRIIYMFTKEIVKAKLIIVEYIRDKGKVLIKNVSISGKVDGVKELVFRVD